MEDETYGAMVLLISGMSAENIEAKKRWARRTAAQKLFDILYQPEQPLCMVRIRDEVRPAAGRGLDVEAQEYRVWFEISLVRERHVG